MSGPAVWGPHGWKFIHYVTLGYPNNPDNNDKQNYLNFFESLKNVIPCSICGNHFKEHMKAFPLTDNILSNKKKFIEWGINMHNLVNEINDKRIFTFEEGFKEIQKNSDDCSENFSNSIIKNDSIINYQNIGIILLIIILSVILFLKIK